MIKHWPEGWDCRPGRGDVFATLGGADHSVQVSCARVIVPGMATASTQVLTTTRHVYATLCGAERTARFGPSMFLNVFVAVTEVA